ncbi:MAG: hypothetical protein WC426_03975 [Sulfuriferula sp.]
MQDSAQVANQPALRTLDGLLFSQISPSARRNFYLGLAAVVAAICVWIALHQPTITFPVDDAYITLHNAKVLRSGLDSNYPGSPALAGATSTIHLALVAGLMTVLPAVTASFVVGAIALLFYTLGLARLAFHLGGSRLLAFLTVIMGTLSGYEPYHLLNGLETGLAMAAGTWVLIFALSQTPSWRLALLCGLLPFIRPEFFVLSILLMGRQSWLRWQHRPVLSPLLLDGIILMLSALPWLLWIHWDTGQFIPATISAKAAYFAEGGLPAAVKLINMLSAINIMTVVTALLGFLLIPRTALTVISFAFFIAFMTAYYLQLPGGLHHNYFRYLQILAPFSLFALISNARHRSITQYLIPLATLLVVWTLPVAWSTYVNGNANTQYKLAAVAVWANSNLPDDARILIHDTGYLAYATRFELVDVVGLKTPASVEFHERLTEPSLGKNRAEAINQIASHFRPTYAIILNDDGKFWGKIAFALEGHGWKLQLLRPAPNIGDYAVYRLAAPS